MQDQHLGFGDVIFWESTLTKNTYVNVQFKLSQNKNNSDLQSRLGEFYCVVV